MSPVSISLSGKNEQVTISNKYYFRIKKSVINIFVINICISMVLVQVNSKNGIYSISIRSTKLRSHKNKK